MRMAAPQYIVERRLADPLWVRRWKRSLGRNKRFRACVRMGHELRKEMEKLKKQVEQDHDTASARISRRLNEFLSNTARMFMPRRTTS